MPGNFVTNGAVLAGPKVAWDGISTQLAQPNMYVDYTDYNALRDACNGLRAMARTYDARGYMALDGIGHADADLNGLMQSLKPGVGQNPPVGAKIVFPPGAKILCAAPLVVPNWISLEGDEAGSTYIFPTPTFNAAALITNEIQDGTGEFFGLANLYIEGGKGIGAVCSTAVVDVVSMFVPSYLRNLIMVDGSAQGLRLYAKGTPGGAGPVLVSNVWVARHNGHNLLIDEDPTNTGSVAGYYLHHVISENQGSNKSAVYIKGRGHSNGLRIDNLHIEMGGVAAGAVGITLDGFARVNADVIQIQGNAATATAGIVVTNAATNKGLQLRSVTNINAIQPILTSAIDGTSVGASTPLNLDSWVSPDVAVVGGPRFRASAAGTAGRAIAVQDAAGTDRCWWNGDGIMAGNSAGAGAGLSLASAVGAAIDRPLAVLDATARDGAGAGGHTFTFEFPSGAGGALQVLCNGTPAMQISPSGAIFLYGNITVQGSLQVQGNLGVFNHATAAKPTVTGSKASNAALASLITALASLGAVTDSST